MKNYFVFPNNEIIKEAMNNKKVDDDQFLQITQCYSGLTKREHFASIAMQGYLANPNASEFSLKEIAAVSVACADELIEALQKDY